MTSARNTPAGKTGKVTALLELTVGRECLLGRQIVSKKGGQQKGHEVAVSSQEITKPRAM